MTIVDNSIRQTDTKPPAQKSPESHPGVEWANWALVLVGGLTGLAIWQQTVATRTAAQAALLNAQAVINAERALLLFKSALDENGDILTVSVVNYGRVPARNIEISKPIMATMKLEDLVISPPDYGDDLDDIQEWLAPNESWIVARVSPKWTRLERFYDAERKKLQLPDVDHITYGQVTYFDGISKDRRHSRYCIAMDDDPYRPINTVGNEEYLECT